MGMGNFTFLSGDWTFLLEDAKSAEKYASNDPRASALYARRTLEICLKWIYKNDSSLKAPYKITLSSMIHERSFKSQLPHGLFNDLRFIQKLGNLAAHDDQNLSAQESMNAVTGLHQFLTWVVRMYSQDAVEPPAPFQQNFIPKSDAEKHSNVIAMFKAKDMAEQKAKEKLTETEAELSALKAELEKLQKIKTKNKKSIGPDEYSESQTRELMIDVMLREAGWDPKAENVEEYEVTGMPTSSGERTGRGKVDYVLWGSNGKPVALVEAKKTKVDPEVGKRQAELYADCLEQQFGQRPVIYYSNGYTTKIWDDTFYPPREVNGFATQDELQWKIKQRPARQTDLRTIQHNPDIAGRKYQVEAAARVMDAFGEQRKRKALIVMATGTGKTRLSISIVDMMMRAGWIRKVLFLADRVSLVKQAKKNFNKILQDYNVASLLEKGKNEDPTNARVIFSTYPTMMNLIDGSKKGENKESFSVGHFDLIFVDEAHRSVYQKYGAIFDYFDSFLVGLTATPKVDIDRNTYKLFELEDKLPTFAYDLDEAVADGFLVPPKALSIPFRFMREGVKYNDLSPEEQEEYEAQEEFYDDETGELVEEISSTALNQWLFNANTVDKALAYLVEHGIKVEGGDRLGKTIIFAKNNKHAQFIVDRFDAQYPKLAGKFCQKIDYTTKYAQSLIEDFEGKDKNPHIAVSVDMMDTGIDVPEVVNLVFFKIVKSKTKFWQMVGRGTRLCEDLFFPGVDKKEFLIFDLCQNLEFFDANPEGFESKTQDSLKQKIFNNRLELISGLTERDIEPELTNDLKNQLNDCVKLLNVDNFIVRKHRKDVEHFKNRSNWNSISKSDEKTLVNVLSGLPYTDNDEEYARRLDLLILNLQLAILRKNSAQAKYILNIRRIASDLEMKDAIPLVNAEIELIKSIQQDEWWKEVSYQRLENTRLRLRDLIKFIDNSSRLPLVFTDFQDKITGVVREVDFVKPSPDFIDYRKQVQTFINNNRDHITIRRLQNNSPLTQTDISALEDILFSEDGPISREKYEELFDGKPLGILVRSVVGLNKTAATKAFEGFLQKASLMPDQITFLNQIIRYLTQNGVMEPKVMFETPFTNIDEQGLSGLFNTEESLKVVQLIKGINENALIENK